jgi:long-chain acyl-CoA synthetase
MKESAIVAAVRAAAGRHASHPALITSRESLIYGELERRAARTAAMVSRSAAASMVGLLYPNSAGFVAGLLGALWAGKTVAILPSVAPPPLLKLMAAEAGFDFVLAAEELAPRAVEAGLTAASIPAAATSKEDPHAGATDQPIVPRAFDEAVLLYTSGTTGRPKAVALSESNLLANVEGCRIAGDFTADDVMLAILPLFHAFGLTVTVLLPLVLGGKVVLEDRFVPRTVLQSVETNRVTALIGVPSQYRLLAKEPVTVDARSLRLCIAGAERLPEQVSAAFAERFERNLLQGYGATEASPVISFNRPQRNCPASVGVPLPNIHVTIREGQNDLPSGDAGEVCVQGPSVMMGYYRQPEATAQKIPGGVLRTGDRGWLDREGYLHLAGRADDMIKVAGEKVYPSEIERALEQVSGVEQAVVAGVPDAARGMALIAFVEARPGMALEETTLRAACRERLEAGKQPRSFIIVEQIPRSVSGKVDKRTLLEQLPQSDGEA